MPRVDFHSGLAHQGLLRPPPEITDLLRRTRFSPCPHIFSAVLFYPSSPLVFSNVFWIWNAEPAINAMPLFNIFFYTVGVISPHTVRLQPHPAPSGPAGGDTDDPSRHGAQGFSKAGILRNEISAFYAFSHFSNFRIISSSPHRCQPHTFPCTLLSAQDVLLMLRARPAKVQR